MKPIIAYGQTIGRDWIQEWYDTRSGDARRRAAQLRKLGYTVSVESSEQVTPVGRVHMTLLTVHQVADPHAVPPPEKIERMNPGARWHGRQATEAEEDRVRAEDRGSFIGSHFYRGKREAHRESQDASRALGLNPKEKIFGVFIESKLNEEILAAAKWLAAKGLKGQVGDPLPDGLSLRAFKRIQADPAGFREMVRRMKRQNPGAAWHQDQVKLAEDMEKRETRPRRRTYLKGMADAHALSAHESRKMGLNPAVAYDVFLRGKKIDTVFQSDPSSAEEVKRSLVEHDGYDPDIRVVKKRKSLPPLFRRRRNPRGARTLVSRVFKAERWAKRWARGRPIRKVKGGWQILAGRKRENPDIEMTFNAKAKAVRYASAMRKLGHDIKVVKGQYGTWKTIIREMRKNPIAVYNPPPGRIIYGRVLAVEAQKTNGTHRGKRFRHSFAGDSRVAAYALPDGSVLLKSAAGKRLWADR